MSIIENAIQWMENVAKDNSHGYDQIYRWGEKGDYDCSAAVITAWQQAGVPVKTNGATYTGNMLSVFLKSGFKDVTGSVNLATGAGLKRGDVLLNTTRHTAMYCGNGLEVEASINEKGTATGGVPGDQTGKEFLIRSYRNYPWTHVLRYEGSGEVASNNTQHSVNKLIEDGSWGPDTTRRTQLYLGTIQDGIVSNQPYENKKYLPNASLASWQFKVTGYSGGSAMVRALQKLIGAVVDGWFGKESVTKLQKFLGVPLDGSMGPVTVKAWQTYLNNH